MAKNQNDQLLTIDRVPPQDLVAEQCVLGCILINNTLDKVRAILPDPDMFYSVIHQHIYTVMLKMADEQVTVDMVLLGGRMGTECGGKGYLAELIELVPTPLIAQDYAKVVREKHYQRQLIRAYYKAGEGAYGEKPLVEILSEGKEIIEETIDGALGTLARERQTGFSDSIKETYDNIENRIGKELEFPTGLGDLDERIGGLCAPKLITVGARTSMGKAQPLNAKILTPNGWVLMKDIRVGDKVISSNGLSSDVMGVFPQGPKKVFKVMMNDRSSAQCTEDHLWFTQTRNERRQKKEGKIRSLKEIMKSLYHCNKGGKWKNHSIKRVKPIDFSYKNLPLDPYILGVLIGDGKLGDRTLKLFTADSDIVVRVQDCLPIGDTITKLSGKINYSIRRKQHNNEPAETRKIIEKLGLYKKHSWEKFIPSEYLLSSIEQRVALLQGLIDTDGHIICSKWQYNGWIEYSTASVQLCKDIIFLIKCLGGQANYIERRPKYVYNGERRQGRVAYRIFLRLPNGIIPVNCKRKKKKFMEKMKSVARPQYIKDIKYMGIEEVQCIKTNSPDGLYVTDDFILTHNTAFALTVCRYGLKERQKEIIYVSLEMGAPELIRRLLTGETGVDLSRFAIKNLSLDDLEKINVASREIAKWKLTILDNLEEIAQIEALSGQIPCDLIVVDYIQLVAAREEETRALELGRLTYALKRLAKKRNIPILVVSQLSRKAEGRRPILGDLRESGGIEENSDQVLLLYRPGVENPKEDPQDTKLYIAKNRDGMIGKVDLSFHLEKLRFFEGIPDLL